MPRTFIRDLANALHRQYSKMWMVGEVFERDAAHTAFFIGGHRGWDGIDTRLDSDFDFSLWSVALDVFTNKKPMRALPEHLKYDALYPDAAKLTTLTNNHDTRRFMSIEGATLKGAMLHTAFALSVRGIPQLYSGEEIAMEGGDDPDNRRDFPGGFPDDQHNAFTLRGRSEDQQRMWQWTRDWISLRREHPALRHGSLIDLYADNDIYAFARQNEQETVVIVINRSGAQRKITISASALNLHEGATLSSPNLPQDTATVMNGAASVSAPAGTAVAYLVR